MKQKILALIGSIALIFGVMIFMEVPASADVTQNKTCQDKTGRTWKGRVIWGAIYHEASTDTDRITVDTAATTTAANTVTTYQKVTTYAAYGTSRQILEQTLTWGPAGRNYANGTLWLTRNPRNPQYFAGDQAMIKIEIGTTSSANTCVMQFFQPASVTPSPTPTVTPTPTPTPTPTVTPTPSSTPTSCGGPITITQGGTYSGCYESANANTPAINITTTAAVTISGATIKHRGLGVNSNQVRTNLTIKNSTFTATDPGTPVDQEGVYLYQPSAVVIENNSFTNDHAILINGSNLATSPLSIKRNDFTNIGHFGQPVCCLGAVHFDKVNAPGGQISWNRVINTYGQSLNEDVFGIYQSNGASGNPMVFDHNLINGSYPMSGDGAGFTGTCMNLGDDSGSWQTGDSNTGVNCTNIGFAAGYGSTGHDLVHKNSTTVSDGLAGIDDQGPRVSSTFGNGFNAAGGNYTGPIIFTDNKSGQRRWNGTTWESVNYYLPGATTNTGNTGISPLNAAAEQAAVDAWESARVAAGVVVGPN